PGTSAHPGRWRSPWGAASSEIGRSSCLLFVKKKSEVHRSRGVGEKIDGARSALDFLLTGSPAPVHFPCLFGRLAGGEAVADRGFDLGDLERLAGDFVEALRGNEILRAQQGHE